MATQPLRTRSRNVTSAGNTRRGVSVVIRFHNPSQLAILDYALFSLLCQEQSPIEAVIVAQNFSTADMTALKNFTKRHDWEARHVTPKFLNVEIPAGVDGRSKLLNAGIAAATQRYLAILDYDDYMYGSAYQHLIERAEKHNVAIAFGKIAVKEVYRFDQFSYNTTKMRDSFDGERSVERLFRDNFLPIHSFVLDRNQVDSRDIYFNESICRLEDYDFFLRICSAYPVDFGDGETYVGVYNYWINGSNTVLRGADSVAILETGTPAQIENYRRWAEARRQVWRVKKHMAWQWNQTKLKTEALLLSAE